MARPGAALDRRESPGLGATEAIAEKGDPMNRLTTRRELLRAGRQGVLATAVVAAFSDQPGRAGLAPHENDVPRLWPGFPRQDATVVAEVVGASHFDEPRVRELVKGYPELVNAWWDWGFGDWESPLGAAAHTGQRAIAEFLLAEGARIDLFAAAMLGFTDMVKAVVAAQPGIQRTRGPHGIPLLAHARAGGEKAADTVAFLESLGDAGVGLDVTPLPVDQQPKYLGEFATGEHELKLVCRLNRNGMLVVDVSAGGSGSNNRMIQFLGEDQFFPSGVPSVRMHFAVADGKAKSLSIRGSIPELTLHRTGD
jgi:hypothetical protein